MMSSFTLTNMAKADLKGIGHAAHSGHDHYQLYRALTILVQNVR